MTRADVVLAPDGSGKSVATYQLTRLDPGTGLVVTEQVQIIAMADELGNAIDLSNLSIQMRMLRMLQRIAGALEQGLDLGINFSDDQVEEDALEVDNANQAIG